MNTVLAGVGIAAATGLLMGAVAKPDLRGDDRPEGPQIMTGSAAGRSTGPFDYGAAAFANDQGRIPDYVLGTDWKKATSPPLPRQPRQPEPSLGWSEEPPPEPVAMAQAIYDEPPPPPPGYPSIDGGAD